jgi:NAD(P)-dependent dehydrogenase (short-subunit alcohol dehydrogenase family)
MKVAFGLRTHSGWAALVALGKSGDELVVVDRSRLELVEEEWAKQPYHAAEELEKKEAREVVKRGIAAAKRIARRELRAAVNHERDLGNQVIACSILVGSPMPDWTVDQILAVHFRMHQAEGVLFRDVLIEAANECELKVVTLPEKTLLQEAEKLLRTSTTNLTKTMAVLGKSAGPPWGKDQKDAALAALVGLG